MQPTQSAPPAANPGSATPAVKNISLGELQRELSGPSKAPQLPAKEAAPVAPAKQVFKEEGANIVVGDDKGNRHVEPTLPTMRDAARKLAEQKKAEESAPKDDKVVKKAAEPTKKEVVSADDAPPAKPNASSEDVPEEQLRVLPHDKPDTAKRISKFLSREAQLKKDVETARNELAEAKKAGSGASSEELTKLREDLKKTQDDLVKYRRLADIDSDPEFKSKYDEPMAATESNIEATLKRNNFTEPALKAIKELGGFAEFSRSQRAFTFPDPADKTKTVSYTAAELARGWLNGLNPADAAAITAELGKQQLLKSERASAREKAGAEARAHYESQTKAQREEAERAAAQQKEGTEKFRAWLTETTTKTDWLRDVEIPADATEEQKAELTARNEFAKELRDSLDTHPKDALDYGRMKLEAAQSRYFKRELDMKDAEIARLREELKTSKGALRTTPKHGSILRGGDAPKTPEPADPTDFRTAMRNSARNKTTSIDE